MRLLKLTLAAGAITLAGCATSQAALPDAQHTAVKSNIDAQAITPPEQQKANRNIPHDRALRDAARKRYRTDTVKQPKKTGTQ